MTGYIAYGGMQCECGGCGAQVSENNAQMVILWANQHGTKIRIFCDLCGLWTDRSHTTKGGHRERVFRPVIPHPTYVDRVFESEAPDG